MDTTLVIQLHEFLHSSWYTDERRQFVLDSFYLLTDDDQKTLIDLMQAQQGCKEAILGILVAKQQFASGAIAAEELLRLESQHLDTLATLSLSG